MNKLQISKTKITKLQGEKITPTQERFSSWEEMVTKSLSPFFYIKNFDWCMSDSWETGSYNDIRDRLIFVSPAKAAKIIERYKKMWG